MVPSKNACPFLYISLLDAVGAHLVQGYVNNQNSINNHEQKTTAHLTPKFCHKKASIKKGGGGEIDYANCSFDACLITKEKIKNNTSVTKARDCAEHLL